MSSVTSRAPRATRKAASVDLPAPLGPSRAKARPSRSSTVACSGSSPRKVSAALSTKFRRLASKVRWSASPSRAQATSLPSAETIVSKMPSSFM